MTRNKKTPEEIYDSFWKDIVEKDGVVDMVQIKRELADFHVLIEEVPKVYSAVSWGMISKPTTCAHEVIREFEDHFFDKGIVQDDIGDILKAGDLTDEQKLEDIKSYLEI